MSKKIEQNKKPYFPAKYDLADVAAIQDLCEGKATPEQQIRAVRWIVEQAADTYGLTFYPNEPDCCAFADGKAFVGQQVVKLSKLNRNSLKEKSNE